MSRSQLVAKASVNFLLLTFLWLSGCDTKKPPPTISRVNPQTDRLSQIAGLLRAGRLPEAEKQVVSLLAEKPNDPVALALAGEVATAAGQHDVAADRYLSAAKFVKDSAGRPFLMRAARCAARVDRFFPAIELLQQCVSYSPNDHEARQELAGLLLSVGMEWDSLEHLVFLVQQSKAGVAELIVLTDRNRPQTQEKWVQSAIERAPHDLRPLIGTARSKAYESNWTEALKLTDQILAKHQDFLPAWILQGRAQLETNDRAGFAKWLEKPLANAQSHPDYWQTLAIAAAQQGDLQGAARAYYESFCLDTGNREVGIALAPILAQLGEEKLAKEVATQTQLLESMVESVDDFIGWQRQSQLCAGQVSSGMLALGRYWEAEAWARMALQLSNDPDPKVRQLHPQTLKQLRPGMPFIDPAHHPRRWADQFAKFALPKIEPKTWNSQIPSPSLESRSSTTDLAQSSALRFSDVAQARGLIFKYENGDDPAKPGMWIHQSNGGGVSIIDYDRDGWPDVIFPQAGCDPLKEAGPLQDQLLHNIEGTFRNVTNSAGADDNRLTQGIGVGDYNDDGFPDLLVGNIGKNRLYRNNGDGSFQDVSVDVPFTSGSWSTSMVIADLDGDGINDLFEVNYCSNEGTYTQACYGGPDGKQIMVCTPTAFAPEPDYFYKGNGDGTFTNRTEDMLKTEFSGRGLGALVTDFDGKPGLELFIANDMSANHFWVYKEADGKKFFDEQAAVRGVANDRRGKPQACMGIASGDIDHDGDVDMVITNFAQESNAFYVQRSPGFFEDMAGSSGLSAYSFDPLGFGTQSADFDGDGFEDLVVANGHVIDYHAKSGEWAMFPQGFSYRDRWYEINRKTLGPYFESKHVGRGMALLDVQRDGWPDIVISHLVEPACLLENQSSHTSQPLTIELVGTTGPRDAVGAKVELIRGNDRTVRWRTAGDGFQCTNEPKLWFNMQPGEMATLKVQWPAGEVSQYSVTSPGSYLAVQGVEALVPRIITEPTQ